MERRQQQQQQHEETEQRLVSNIKELDDQIRVLEKENNRLKNVVIAGLEVERTRLEEQISVVTDRWKASEERVIGLDHASNQLQKDLALANQSIEELKTEQQQQKQLRELREKEHEAQQQHQQQQQQVREGANAGKEKTVRVLKEERVVVHRERTSLV